MHPHILIVDDDQRLRSLLWRYIKQQEKNWHISTCAHVEEALVALELFHFSAIILDIMMSGQSGLSLLDRPLLPPVFLLSALGEPHHRIEGLERGACDYLVKPFEPRELMLRLNNIVSSIDNTLIFGSKLYCLKTGVLYEKKADDHVKKIPITTILTAAESKLLHYLAQRVNSVVTRSQIAADLWPEAQSDRCVDMQINRLRKKIERDITRPALIISVRGQGYCLRGQYLHPEKSI